jgi:hypothetical protein
MSLAPFVVVIVSILRNYTKVDEQDVDGIKKCFPAASDISPMPMIVNGAR